MNPQHHAPTVATPATTTEVSPATIDSIVKALISHGVKPSDLKAHGYAAAAFAAKKPGRLRVVRTQIKLTGNETKNLRAFFNRVRFAYKELDRTAAPNLSTQHTSAILTQLAAGVRNVHRRIISELGLEAEGIEACRWLVRQIEDDPYLFLPEQLGNMGESPQNEYPEWLESAKYKRKPGNRDRHNIRDQFGLLEWFEGEYTNGKVV